MAFGDGLGGFVAETATPSWTDDYHGDSRYRHTASIDSAVRREELVAILGVPLLLGRQVIGVLYAANRSAQVFSRDDVNLLASLAAHAAVALDNARLLAETRAALADLKTTSTLLQRHVAGIERAADAHDRLAAIAVRGGDASDVVHEVRQVLGGQVFVMEADGTCLASTAPPDSLSAEQRNLLRDVLADNETVTGEGICVTPVRAGSGSPALLMLVRDEPVDDVARRILERAATVTALMLVIRRSVADTEIRLRGDLLADVITKDGDPDSLRVRARRLGTELDGKHSVVVAQVDGERSRAARAAEHLAAVSQGLSTVQGHRIVVVLPGQTPDAAGELVARELRPVTGVVTVGAAGPTTGLGTMQATYQEAANCVDALIALGRRGDVASARRLGFVGLLLGGDRDVGGFVTEHLGAVLDYDRRRGTELLHTLEVYFAQAQHVARTAADLRVHPNTVTQRLDRVASLLGTDWNEPERQLEVRLAMRLARLAGSASCS